MQNRHLLRNVKLRHPDAPTRQRYLEAALGTIAIYVSRRVPGVQDTENLAVRSPLTPEQSWHIQLALSITPGSDPAFIENTVTRTIQSVSHTLTATVPDIAVSLTQSMWPSS